MRHGFPSQKPFLLKAVLTDTVSALFPWRSLILLCSVIRGEKKKTEVTICVLYISSQINILVEKEKLALFFSFSKEDLLRSY